MLALPFCERTISQHAASRRVLGSAGILPAVASIVPATVPHHARLPVPLRMTVTTLGIDSERDVSE
jgi:hypothetical protein